MPVTNLSARTAKKLTHLFRLIIRLPDLVKPEKFLDENNRELIAPTPLGLVLAKRKVIPFWLDQCPPEYQEDWKNWMDIHNALVEMSQLTLKSELTKWDWVEAGLGDVLNLARKQCWDACADQLITNFLNEEGVGIQTMYRSPANYERIFKPGKEQGKGFLSASTWDSHLGEFLPRLLGDAIRGESLMLPEVATTWWHGTIQSLLDAASKQRGRSEASLRKIEQTVEKLFGPDWLKAGIPKDFNLRKARSALRTLRGYKTHLMWQLISSKDVKIMEEPMSFANADVQKHLEAHWESLTENARKMEFCQVAIGWMLGVVQAKNGTTPEEPIDFGGERDEDLMKYGIALGRVTSKKQLAHFAEPSEVEIQQFNLEVADFIDMWLGRSQIDNLNTATALYRNPELEIQLQQYLNEGEDIGTGPFQRFTPTELHAYLGFPPDRQLPVGFRKFTADDPKAIPDGAHEESFEGSSPVSISWHQLVFVAVLFTHLTSSQKANLQKLHHSGVPSPGNSLLAIQEEWARIPGTCLFDEVGLGKTLCCLSAIATFQHVYALQEGWKAKVGTDSRQPLPACIRDAPPFGARVTGIPNNAHLIIVPTSLVDQWENEIRRFFRADAIHLIVVRAAAKCWADDMMRIRQENVPKIRQIVLVSHSVLQRMFSINRGKIQKVQVDDMPRLCYRPPPHTLYSFSWCSAWVDEAHESRTGKALWRSISAIFEVSLAKVLITATPLLEQPEDLMNLALLVRPPSMNFKEQANMRFMTRDLRLVKSRTTIKTHQDALELMARDRIVPQTEGGAVALLSSTMVKVVQRHLVPHTVRRSNNSVDNQGTRLSALLPPCTIMHVSVEVTNEESQASYEELEKDAVTGRHFDVATLGRFFNDGRLKLSFPNPGKWTLDEYNEAALNSDSATKLKCLIELCRAILLNGAEAVVPTEYHGSQDRILDTATFGLPDLIQGYRLRPLKKEEKNREKIIVYTTFAKFHLYMTKIFEAAGISVVAISGAITARDRTKRIERFMMDPDINVLLMSVVGQTGLNLTAGRVLILYEANWSNVQSRQLYGRVYRRGQKRSTFIFQLMAAKTVEVLLIANDLGKHQLLADFLKVKRNEATLKLLAGRASQEEIDALLEGRDADDELALEVKSQLKSAKSAVGVAMRDRIAQGEQQKKGEGKQNPSDKEEHASTEEEVPRKYKRKQKDAEEPTSKKLKGEDTAKSTPRGSG